MATSKSNYATSTTYSSPYGALPPAGGTNLSAYSAGTTPAWQTATPAPQAGQGAYGAVPGPTDIPPSTYAQAGGVLPQLPALTAKTGQDVMNELNGVLSPETINNIQTHAAQFGVTSGMPGSGLQGNQGLESLGLSTEAVQQQGQQNYGSLLGSLAGTQLNPALISQIQSQNAMLAAAPDPQAAAMQLQKNYLNASKGYGGQSITPPNTSLAPAGYAVASDPGLGGPAETGIYGTAQAPDSGAYYGANPVSADNTTSADPYDWSNF